MKPHELIEAQRDLVMRSAENEDFQRFIAGMLHSQNTDLGTRDAEHDAREHSGPMGQHLSNLTRAADLYQVTEDMTPLIVHAAAGLDELDRWSRHNAPSPVGMARFERPLSVWDVRGREMLCHWIVWGPAQTQDGTTGLAVYMFNDTRTEPDEVQHRLWDEMDAEGVERIRAFQGRWACISIHFATEEERLGPPTTHADPDYQARIIAAGHTPAEATNASRLFHALFLLLGQTIVRTEEAQVPRSHLKLARRMQMPGRITVVMLRRFEGSRYEGESMVQWSHRWVVKGHWRWQPCGPNRSERRRIWIAPFIKGPDGKPLVVTDKVYRLGR